MKAVIWNYRYADMKITWANQMCWMVNSLLKCGCEVKTKGIICSGVNVPEYNPEIDNPCDIAIYNHADSSEIIGNVVKCKQNWFFKPTIPDEVHTTLDTLGYGPYSSITYKKPDFESVDKNHVNYFFNTKVVTWVTNRITKWGVGNFNEEVMNENDYWLVLGQCGGDSVVTKHDFGNYFTKLTQIVTELARVDNRKIIVKLHPYTDGKEATNTIFSDNLKSELLKISPKISVYSNKSNVHNFIKNARGVLLANSGSGFEAMMHGKPIIAWGFPEYHWVSYNLRHLADLKNALSLDWFDVEKQRKFLYWYLEKYCFYDQESCDRRVKELLNNVPRYSDDQLDALINKIRGS